MTTLLFPLLLSPVLGWAAPAPDAQDPPAESTPIDAPPLAAATQLERVQRWTEAAVLSLTRGDAGPLVGAVDERAFLQRAAAGTDVDAAYLFGLRLMPGDAMHLEANLLPPILAGGACALLRLAATDRGARVTLRVLRRTLDLDYHDLEVVCAGDEVRIVDHRQHEVGEWASARLRREKIATRHARGLSQALQPLATVKRAQQLAEAGEHAAALAALDQELDGCIDKDLLLARIACARHLEVAVHADAVETFRRVDPKNPCIHLHLLALHERRGDRTAALAAVDAIDELVGGDPHLEFVRARILRAAGESAAAAQRLDAALAAMPAAPHVHAARLELALASDDFATIARVLAIQWEHGIPCPLDLDGERFAAYRASLEHRRMRAEHATAAPARRERARTHAEQFVQRLAARDGAFLRAALDPHAVCDRCLAGLDVPEAAARDFRWGFVRSFRLADGLATLGGRPRLLHVLDDGDAHEALVRVLLAEGHLHFRMRIGCRAGRYGVLDWHWLAQGEPMSAAGARHARLALSPASDDRDAAATWARLVRAASTGEANEAVAAFTLLPQPLRADRMALRLLVAASPASTEPRLAEVVRDLEQRFPGPDTDYLLLDRWLARGDLDRALATVERLREQLADPYFNVLAAILLQQQGDVAAARARLLDALAAESDLLEAHQALLDLALAAADHVETARVLEELERHGGVLDDERKESEAFVRFTASPAGVAWAKAREARQAGKR